MSGNLINREALLNEIDSEREKFVRNGMYGAKHLMVHPAVDAEPVRHWRWVGVEYGDYADGFHVYGVFECPECGYEHRSEDDTLISYCPNCDVKMDVEETE